MNTWKQPVVVCHLCQRTIYSTSGICQTCRPAAWAAWVKEARERAEPMGFVAMNEGTGAVYWEAADGRIFSVDSYILWMLGGARGHDALVADLMKLREENRDVLAENARLRRRLEGKS